MINDGAEDPRFDEYMKEYSPKKYCKSVIYSCRENRGITKSLNELLSKVDESYTHICLLDLDVLLPVYWLKKCCGVLDHSSNIGLCGILVEDHLEPSLNEGVFKTKDNAMFANVNSIGGACLVFRAQEFKGYGFDETLISDHIDAYIISRYRIDGKKSCTLLERGHHPKEDYESAEFIALKLARYHETMPTFHDIFQRIGHQDLITKPFRFN